MKKTKTDKTKQQQQNNWEQPSHQIFIMSVPGPRVHKT